MGKTLKCELKSTQPVQLEGIRISCALFEILSIGGVKCVLGGAGGLMTSRYFRPRPTEVSVFDGTNGMWKRKRF